MNLKPFASLAIVLVQAGLVLGGAVVLWSGAVPLGVKGEWEWIRITAPPDRVYQGIAVLLLIAFGGFVAVGWKKIQSGGTPTPWLMALAPASLLLGIAVQEAAPEGYGIAKWAIAQYHNASNGYYTVARGEIRHLPEFLAQYPVWIKRQGSLHIGTHPPGLFVVSWSLLVLADKNPAISKAVVFRLPQTLGVAFHTLRPGLTLPPADRAALSVNGLLVAVACACATLPLYALARSRLNRAASWFVASLWAVVPASLMFQPASDTAFPLFSTTAFALAAYSHRFRGLALLCGILLGVGTQLTLVFFPVGLLVAIIYMLSPEISWRKTASLIVLTGVGFLALTIGVWALTSANPFAIWRANMANHAQFYVQYPRSYLAWVLENPAELAVAIGLPTTFLALIGFKTAPKLVWASVALLVFLTLSGKNLSEVGRLWLPLMPPLLLAAGAASQKFPIKPFALAIGIVLVGLQTLILEAAIQVVYPV